MSACSPSKAGIIAVPFINLETVTARGPRKHYSVNFLNTCLTLAGSSCHWIVFSLLLKLNIISFNFNLKEWSSEHITNLENLLKKQIVLLSLKWCPSLIPCTFKMAELQLSLPRLFLGEKGTLGGEGGGGYCFDSFSKTSSSFWGGNYNK